MHKCLTEYYRDDQAEQARGESGLTHGRHNVCRWLAGLSIRSELEISLSLSRTGRIISVLTVPQEDSVRPHCLDPDLRTSRSYPPSTASIGTTLHPDIAATLFLLTFLAKARFLDGRAGHCLVLVRQEVSSTASASSSVAARLPHRTIVAVASPQPFVTSPIHLPALFKGWARAIEPDSAKPTVETVPEAAASCSSPWRASS